MARPTTVWGIEIGQCALKALKLREVEGILQVEAFDVIEHPMILSQPDADRQQIIREALQRFLSKAEVSGCHVVVSVPGQSSFSRFVKLPPVESRRVPDIVRFEAEQQIPFPINEVIWRWQTFRDPDSPEVEVGLFAMKRSDVAEMLGHFDEAGIKVDTVQTAPLALYNFMTFDEQLAEDGATLLADIGADKTDLVVADKGRIWTRTIQIGGNNFTEALVRTFKLSFEKAEKLKRAAASSKYARQIFQSMRPVFADLVQEVQRSVGYYTSLHRDTRFKRLLGLGNGFRLPGLQKFIEQNLNIPVTRIDSYNRIAPSSSASAPAVNEHVLSFAVAYGLALQGLELSEVNTNLLPEEILRKRLWNRKRPWFVAAAIVLVAGLFCPGYRARLDSKTLESRSLLNRANNTARDIEKRTVDYEGIKDKGRDEERKIKDLARLFGYGEFWPSLLTLVNRSIAAVAPDQPRLAGYARYVALRELHRRTYEQLAAGKGEELSAKELGAAAAVLLNSPGIDANSSPALLAELVAKIKDAEAFKAAKRNTRRMIVVEGLTPTYTSNLALSEASAGGGPSAKAAAAGARSKA
ncbi:MAG: type IV pilus assembly protein PilM, partial [Phycisphaerae bacterium]